MKIATFVLKLPRFSRIVWVLATSMAVMVALFPFVDWFYVTYLYTPQTIILPSLFSATVALISYVIGWLLLVGTVGETPPLSRWVVGYVAFGLLVICYDVFLIVRGIAMTDTFAG